MLLFRKRSLWCGSGRTKHFGASTKEPLYCTQIHIYKRMFWFSICSAPKFPFNYSILSYHSRSCRWTISVLLKSNTREKHGPLDSEEKPFSECLCLREKHNEKASKMCVVCGTYSMCFKFTHGLQMFSFYLKCET